MLRLIVIDASTPRFPHRDDASQLTFLCLTLDCTMYNRYRVKRKAYEENMFQSSADTWKITCYCLVHCNCELCPAASRSLPLYWKRKMCRNIFVAFDVQNDRPFIKTSEFYGRVWSFQSNSFHRFMGKFFNTVLVICAQRPEDNQKSNRCFTLNPLYWPPRGQQVSSRCPDVLQNLKTKTPVIYDHQNDKYIGEDRTRNMILRPKHVVVKPRVL